MAAIIPNEAEIQHLTDVKAGTFHRIILFKNDLTAVATTVWSGVTEANFSGYARATPSWGAVTTGGDGRAFMTAAPLIFTHNGGATANDVYGWAWIYGDVGSEKIRAIDRIPTPPETVDTLGDSVTVTPTVYLRQQQ